MVNPKFHTHAVAISSMYVVVLAVWLLWPSYCCTLKVHQNSSLTEFFDRKQSGMMVGNRMRINEHQWINQSTDQKHASDHSAIKWSHTLQEIAAKSNSKRIKRSIGQSINQWTTRRYCKQQKLSVDRDAKVKLWNKRSILNIWRRHTSSVSVSML